MLIHRDRRFYGPISGLTGVLYTIPSLALFALLVPITGLSLLTAEIGLVSYTLLILTRHIVGRARRRAAGHRGGRRRDGLHRRPAADSGGPAARGAR